MNCSAVCKLTRGLCAGAATSFQSLTIGPLRHLTLMFTRDFF